MIKMIATDIDGTLVPEGAGKLPGELVEVVSSLIDKGVIFVVASGRSIISIENIFRPLKDKIYYIGCNGCIVRTSGEILFVEELDAGIRNEMIRGLRKEKKFVSFLTSAKAMYDEGTDPELTALLRDGYHEKLEMVDDLTKVTDKCVKLSIYDRDAKPLVSLADFYDKWQNIASVTSSGSVWLDTYKAGVNKGSAVRWLQKQMGILPSETLTMGDQQNDVELLRSAEYSYAVENAVPQAKAAARYIAGSYMDGGAIKVFRSVLEEMEKKA